jgi:hypothetical protein
MSETIFVIMVRNTANLTSTPSILLFDSEAYAVHYIYNLLPNLIAAEVGYPVYIRSCPRSPLFTKYNAKRVEGGDHVDVTITLNAQRTYSREAT